MKEFQTVIMAGASIYLAYRAGSALLTKAEEVERNSSPGLLDLVMLGALGITFLNNLDTAATRTKGLLT